MLERSRFLGGILACLILAAAAGPAAGQVQWRCMGSTGLQDSLTCAEAVRRCVEACGDVRNCEFFGGCAPVDPGDEGFLIEIDIGKLSEILRLILAESVVVIPGVQPDPSPEDFGFSVTLPALRNELIEGLGQRRFFEPGDFQLLVELEGFEPLVLEHTIEEHVLVEENANFDGEAFELVNLFFPADPQLVPAVGSARFTVVNNTAKTSREGAYSFSAVGRGRLLVPTGPARWTCAGGGSGEAPNCLQAALECAANCPGGLLNCDVDCPEPPVIPYDPQLSLVPELVSVGPGVTIPGSWVGYTPDPEGPELPPWPWPWPPIPGPLPLPEVSPAWGLSVVVNLDEVLIGLDQPFFRPGDWTLTIELADGDVVEIDDFIEDPLDLDGSGAIGDGDGEGLSLFFHTSDRDLAGLLEAGDFRVGLRNNTAGTPRQGDYGILDLGRGRVFPGAWLFRTARWTAHCNAPGSEPVSGIAPNVLQAQIDCEVACRSEGGVQRCEIDGGPLPLPWFEREYILPDILRVNPFELPAIADLLPLPRDSEDEPGPWPPVSPAPWGFSVFLGFDVLGGPPVAAGRDFFEPEDFVLLFADDPSPQPSHPMPPDLAGFLFLERPIQEMVDLDASGLVGDAEGEGVNLFFTTDDDDLRRQIDAGATSIGLLNRTANTRRAGLYAIGAIGRGRVSSSSHRVDLVPAVSACGDSASVFVVVTSPEPISGLQLGFEWDPALLELADVVAGPDVPPERVHTVVVDARRRHLGEAVAGLTLKILGGPIDASSGVRALELKLRAAASADGSPSSVCLRNGLGNPPLDVVVTVKRGEDYVSVRPSFGCTSVALVPDTTPPQIVCPRDIEVAGTPNGAIVEWPVEVFDDCEVTVACEPPSGSVFPIGTTTVVCTATDSSGNVSECSFEVVITETAGFRRADANVDGKVDVSDPIQVLSYLFLGGRLRCADAADSNDDGAVDVTDPISILSYTFVGGAPPAVPGPFVCGEDPTPDELPECDYEACF